MRSASIFQPALEHLLQRLALPPEKFGHQPRLYLLTRRIGTGFAYDEDVVCAAAYLHDLGVFVGQRPEDPETLARWDHVAYAVEHARAHLAGLGFPREGVPAVLDAIRTHQPQDEPRSVEAVVLRDADILEQLGAVGVLRTVAKIGRDTRFPTFTPAVESLRRALDRLPNAILLETTRALAQPRLDAMRAFVDAVEAEGGEYLY